MQRELLCIAIGLGVGYYAAKMRLESDFYERLDAETEEARNHYRDLYDRKIAQLKKDDEGKKGEKVFREDVVAAAEALTSYKGITVDADVSESLSKALNTEPVDVTVPPYIQADIAYSDAVRETDVNLSTEEESAEVNGFNYNKLQQPDPEETEAADEEAEVDTDYPYHISQETFFEEGQDKQYSITWYEGDTILAGQRDKEIPDNTIEMTVGRKHLNMFGQKSDDADTVYVRNESMGCDFEITRNKGKYREVVLGESG